MATSAQLLGLAPLAALLPLGACTTEPVDDSFRVVDFEIAGPDQLRLTFSEPLANPAQVDPADFRLSTARTFDVEERDGTVPLTVYSGWQSSGIGAVTPGAPDELIVTVNEYVDLSERCDYVDYYLLLHETYEPDERYDLGVFLHYARGDIPITGASSGAALADISPDWVDYDGFALEVDRFGFINPLRIPCP